MSIAIFLAFTGFVLGLSFWLGRKAKTASGYFAAHGQVGAVARVERTGDRAGAEHQAQRRQRHHHEHESRASYRNSSHGLPLPDELPRT